MSTALETLTGSRVGEFCFTMIGRADIEGSKSDVTMNAWPPRASYPHGDVSDTSCLKPQRSERSGGPTFMVYIHTENQDQVSSCPSSPWEASVLPELILGLFFFTSNSQSLFNIFWMIVCYSLKNNISSLCYVVLQ